MRWPRPGRKPSVSFTIQVLQQHSRAQALRTGVFSSGLALLLSVGTLVLCPSGSELSFPCLHMGERIMMPTGGRWSGPLFEHLVQSRCPGNDSSCSCRWETGAGDLGLLRGGVGLSQCSLLFLVSWRSRLSHRHDQGPALGLAGRSPSRAPDRRPALKATGCHGTLKSGGSCVAQDQHPGAAPGLRSAATAAVGGA